MGSLKNQMMANDDNRAYATSLLVDFGTLQECENHSGTFFEGDGDMEAAYRRANTMISRGEIKLGDRTRREFTDSLKEAFDEHWVADGCNECAEKFG